jgi:tetratricopeptide (TPR) repeat protein
MSNRLALFFLVVASAAAQCPGGDPLAMGLEYFSQGRFPEAEACLRNAVASQPRAFDARLALGATLAERQHTREAIEQLEQAHRLKPDHPDALKLLAAQYMMVHDYRKAIAVLAPLSSADQERYLLLIESYQISGDAEKAFALARQAATLFPSSPQINCWIGFQLQFSGRYEDARVYLEKALRLDPQYPPGYYLLGDAFLKEHKFRESLPYFQQAIELSPKDMDAHIGLSHAWVGMADLAKALEVLKAAANDGSADARIHLQLSRLYFRMGDQARAEQEAALALRLKGQNGSVGAIPSSLRSGHE